MKVRGYKRAMDALAYFERGVICLLLFGEVALTAANVFSRYVIHQSWSFTEEVVVAVMVLMSLIGAALCARDRGGLINLTLFTDKLPKKTRIILEIIMMLGVIFFAVVMVKYGIDRCITQIATNRRTSALQLPEWYYTSFVPIGGALMTIHSLEHIADCIFEIKDGEEE